MGYVHGHNQPRSQYQGKGGKEKVRTLLFLKKIHPFSDLPTLEEDYEWDISKGAKKRVKRPKTSKKARETPQNE